MSAAPLPLWKKFWLLFAVIWIVVAGLQVATILFLSDEPQKWVRPALLGLGVPAIAYGVLWLWFRLRTKPAE